MWGGGRLHWGYIGLVRGRGGGGGAGCIGSIWV